MGNKTSNKNNAITRNSWKTSEDYKICYSAYNQSFSNLWIFFISFVFPMTGIRLLMGFICLFSGKPLFLFETTAKFLARSFFNCYLFSTTKIFFCEEDCMDAMPTEIFSLIIIPSHSVKQPLIPFFGILNFWFRN